VQEGLLGGCPILSGPVAFCEPASASAGSWRRLPSRKTPNNRETGSPTRRNPPRQRPGRRETSPTWMRPGSRAAPLKRAETRASRRTNPGHETAWGIPHGPSAPR
jgi:hypothetical protein